MHNMTQSKQNFELWPYLTIITITTSKTAHFAKPHKKSRNYNFLVIFILLKGMTNLNSQKDEGNGTLCRPRPPTLHPQLDDFSIKL